MPGKPKISITGNQNIRIPTEGPNGSTFFQDLNITYVNILPTKDSEDQFRMKSDATRVDNTRQKAHDKDIEAKMKLNEVKRNLINRIWEYKNVKKATNKEYVKQYETLAKMIEDGSLTLKNVPNDLYFSSLKKDFDKYFELLLPYHLIVERKARLGELDITDGEKGITLAIISGSLSVGSDILYDKKSGEWYSPKQKKYYSKKFYGNQYTPKQKTVVKNSKWMSRAGRALGYYGIYNSLKDNLPTLMDYESNTSLENARSGMEIFSSVFSTFGGSIGVAWGIGWELGRLITEQDWYNETKEQWIYNEWRKSNLGF